MSKILSRVDWKFVVLLLVVVLVSCGGTEPEGSGAVESVTGSGCIDVGDSHTGLLCYAMESSATCFWWANWPVESLSCVPR